MPFPAHARAVVALHFSKPPDSMLSRVNFLHLAVQIAQTAGGGRGRHGDLHNSSLQWSRDTSRRWNDASRQEDRASKADGDPEHSL